jgi:uncharacterized protein (DUF885 family)
VPGTEFDALVREFLIAAFDRSPVTATMCGVSGYDHRLPDLSAEAIADGVRSDAAWAERFSAQPDAQLADDDRFDRDLAVMHLRRRAIENAAQDWRRWPDQYVHPVLDGVNLLFTYRLHPEADLVDAAVARLGGLPTLLAAARNNLDAEVADPLLVRRSVRQLAGARSWLVGTLPVEVADTELRGRLGRAGEAAAAALDEHAAWLSDFADRARGTYMLGEPTYSALLREAEGLDYGAAELLERGRAAVQRMKDELRRRARAIDGDDDWQAWLARTRNDHPDSPDEMRQEYDEYTQRARAFCVDRDLVTMPAGERCEVVPAPHFMRPVLAVAAYQGPPALTARRTGWFYVPYPPEGAPRELVRGRLAGNNRWTMPSIAVHEAYPGHHWQITWSVADGRRPLRLVVGSSYFVEGWGLYSEQLMYDQGFYTDPRAALGAGIARMFRAARIVLDVSLHVGEMSVDESVHMLRELTGLSEESARAEVERYCAWPTQAPAYMTGCLEIERMQADWLTGRRGTLREFHDRIGAAGFPPIGLAERLVR